MQTAATVELLLLLLVAYTSAFPLLSDTPRLTEEASANLTLQDVAADPSLQEVAATNETEVELDNNGANNAANESDSTNGGFEDIVKSVRDHDKVRRLEAIRMAILNSTGRTERPIGSAPSADHATTYQAMMEQLIQKMMPWASVDGFTERVQSFYPVCVPLHKPTTTPVPSTVALLGDQAVTSTPQPVPPPPPMLPPTDEMSLVLFFNLSYPTPIEGSELNIVAARLKLYKFSQENQNNSNTVTPCTTRRTAESLEAVAKAAAANNSTSLPLPVGLREPYVDDDRRIRVSVYYYTRSQKRNKLRRKLLDTKMVPMLGDEWVDLNVRAAARLWRNESKNLGLVIEVEDEEGKQQAASRFFNDMNCSKEASTSRPIPSFLMDAVRERNGHQNASLPYNSDLFPVIDLCTMDIPKQEKINKPVVAMVSDHMTPIPPPYHSVDLHHSHSSHQHGINGFINNNNQDNNKGSTTVLQNPFYRIYEMQRAHRLNPVPQIRVPDEEEENLEPIVQEQKLQDDPVLRETQLEQQQQQQQQQSSLHPHRHHKKHHLAHSHEDFSTKDRRHDDVEETTDYDQEASSVRRPHHQKHHPYQLHHNFHHHGHHVHPGEGDTTTNDSGEDDWNGKAIRTLVVVPASQFLDLATQLESESQQQQHHKKRRQQRHDDYER